MVKLFPFQQKGLEAVKDLNRVAFYYDMGLGKTFVGAEKMIQLGTKVNLVICQKSKIEDWIKHFFCNYLSKVEFLYDLTTPIAFHEFMEKCSLDYFSDKTKIGIINYELAFRRPELAKLSEFTLMLDESSLIQNENAKRSEFILNKLKPKNVILLSGTPTGGKYENLISQIHLLGWSISPELFWRQYVDYHYEDDEGFPLKIIDGYKNVDRLKRKLREHGCQFMKTDEVFDLPEQIFNVVKIEPTKEYKKFRKSKIVTIGERELVGDTTLTKMLYERMLCGQYNQSKLDAFKDLLESTEDRVIVFYNFTEELVEIEAICNDLERPFSLVNGKCKRLDEYEQHSNSVTIIQYQAGAMGLNLQKANKIIYFTPPLSSELFEQSKKRTHRIGQKSTCFYYELVCKNSIEEKIYKNLAMRRDYTLDLFEQDNA